MRIKAIFVLLTLFCTVSSFANPKTKSSDFQCPEWLTNREADLPICPEGRSDLLVPENYPTAALVVSDDGFTGRDSGFTADVVIKALTGAGKNNPLIILPVSDDTIEKIKFKIESSGASPEQKEKWNKSLLHVPMRGYTWQQDYMQSFLDSSTGEIVIREVEGYRRHGNSYDKIIDAVKQCGFVPGQRLHNNKFTGGHMGGNIEALPGGICLLGDDHFEEGQWKAYADQICNKSDDDRIKVPTAWLNVGHTDEIMKVIRNNNEKSPCNFSVAVASPNKALELLKSNPKGQFLDFSEGRGGKPKDLALRRSNEYRGLRTMCAKKLRLQKNNRKENSSKPAGAISWNPYIKNLLIDMAYAQTVQVRGPDRGEPSDCSTLSNADAYQVFTQDKDLKMYNQLVQEKIDGLKKEVTDKLKRKFPSCNIDILELPDLFFGGQPVELRPDTPISVLKTEDGSVVTSRSGRPVLIGNADDIGKESKFDLPQGMGLSVLPNPTNAISINDTVISPDPSNSVFKDYMQEQYKKRGLNPQFVDTFDYAHQGSGNLHCSTNTMHICKPRGKK